MGGVSRWPAPANRPSGCGLMRADAGYWGLRLIGWIHTTLGAVAVVPWTPKRQKNRTRLPATWTAEDLGKRTRIERFFGRVFSLFGPFRLPRPPLHRVDGGRDTGRAHLRGHRGRRSRRPTSRPARPYPL